MKQYLLLAAGMLTAVGAIAQIAADASVYSAVPTSTRTAIRTSAPVRANVGTQLNMKRVQDYAPAGILIRKTVDPRFNVRKATAGLPEGCVFSESFEGWDGTTPSWIPEDWTAINSSDDVPAGNRWSVDGGNPLAGVIAPDGNYILGINYSADALDEWAVTPEIALSENMELTFHAFLNPMFLFDINYLDWSTYEFIERHVAATLQVMVQADGGEWTKVWDAVDEFADVTGLEMMERGGAFDQYTVDLADYAGKNVRIGFRYVGTDGDTMYIDNIAVGLPALDEVSYIPDFSTLYWGFGRNPGWEAMTLGVAQIPVFVPSTWMNMSPYENATYSWQYCDPVTADWDTSDEQEQLTLTYLPDYRKDFDVYTNLFYSPILSASQPGNSDGSYQSPTPYFNAGGTAQYYFPADDETFTGGLLPFDQMSEGLTYLTVESDFGQLDTPITGYGPGSDEYWYNYTFPGEDNPAYGSYVEGIINFIYPSAAPFTLRGATVLARGKADDDAELTLSVCRLYEGVPDFDNPVATRTIHGSDFIHYDANSDTDYLTLVFDFDEPVVLSAADSEAYIVALTGYHSDKFTYFAPMQSEIPNPAGLCFGWLIHMIKYDSEDYNASLMPLAYLEGPYGECYNAFAINLNGEYGWVGGPEDEVQVPADGTATVALDSYYAGTDLTVEAPEGVSASVAGRYGKTQLSISRAAGYTGAIDGNVTVKSPSHCVSIPVKADASGIEDIVAPDATVEGVFSISGQRVDAAALTPGVYIVRYSDGSVRKTVVK